MKRPLDSLLYAALLLGACATPADNYRKTMATAQVGIVNHTAKYVYSASLWGMASPNGPSVSGGGSNMSRWGAGGADICCASIPRVWYPGMKVTVRWDMPEGHQHIVKGKIVEVEKYDEPGDIYMHFFPDDEVRVVVSNAAGYSRKHPIPPLADPADAPARGNTP